MISTTNVNIFLLPSVKSIAFLTEKAAYQLSTPKEMV